MQEHGAGLSDLLLSRGYSYQRDAAVMAEIDQRITMCVRGDERLQFLDGLRVGEVVELDRVILRIEVDDRVGANSRLEHEIVVTGPTDRNRNGLVDILGWVLGVGEADVVGLRHGLARREIELVIARHELEAD
jgi:hypothetical protein